MSVKIRLNNKRFLGEGLIIGSRLNEEGEVSQTSPSTNASTAQPTQIQTPQPANTSTAQPLQLPQAQSLDQQVNKIIYNGFSSMVKLVETQFKQLQLPEGVLVQWVQVTQPKDQTLQSVWASVQQFLTGNIKAISTALQQKQNAQLSAPVNNQLPQNASTSTPA